jgi:hypothetical protein
MPDWIRTSGLWSRSYQAVKPESTAAQCSGLIMIAQIFGILKKNLGSLAAQDSRGFLR